MKASLATPEVRVMELSKLKPAPYNPRTIDKKAMGGLKRSLSRFGLVEPLVWNRRTRRLVGGHQRLAALKESGVRKASVTVVDLPEKEEKKALNVSLNNALIAGEFTGELAPLLEEIRLDFGDENFSELRLDDLAEEMSSSEIVEDEIPEPPKVAVTKVGDLWKLGTHRLMCGDARNPDHVNRLGLKRIDLALTDPPYCSGGFQEAGRAAGTWGEIAADNLSTRGFVALMTRALKAACPQTAYIFTDWRQWTPLFDVVESSGLAVRSMIVWDKGSPGLGSIWRAQHELVMFAMRKANKRVVGKAAIGNVIRCERSGNEQHYTEKPTKLLATILENDGTAERGPCAVYDPFIGSGSTLIAAEQLGRVCVGMDVEPRWCDVVVERWQTLTGQKATRE